MASPASVIATFAVPASTRYQLCHAIYNAGAQQPVSFTTTVKSEFFVAKVKEDMSGLATAGCEAIVLNELNVAKREVVADILPKGWSLACAEGPDVKYDTTCLALALAPNMV